MCLTNNFFKFFSFFVCFNNNHPSILVCGLNTKISTYIKKYRAYNFTHWDFLLYFWLRTARAIFNKLSHLQNWEFRGFVSSNFDFFIVVLFMLVDIYVVHIYYLSIRRYKMNLRYYIGYLAISLEIRPLAVLYPPPSICMIHTED